MAHDPEVNKLIIPDDTEPHVLKAIQDEHDKFRAELLEKGPMVVPFDTYKPRLRAAMAAAQARGKE